MAMSFKESDCKQLSLFLTRKRKAPEDKQPWSGGKGAKKGVNSRGKKIEQKTDGQREEKAREDHEERNQAAADERRERLSKACWGRLSFSQFRSINEYLYSHSSHEAQTYMNKELFTDYHKAYTEIAAKWPVKPIDEVIKVLEELFKERKTLVLADMGCGDVPQLKRHFAKAEVHSFDLVALDDDVTEADIARVPINKHLCDGVVFCLSLMGTNVKDYIIEANRISKTGGYLIVAEVSSRFEKEGVKEGVKDFTKKVETFGFKAKKEDSLPPNGYFVLLTFVKTANCKKLSDYPDLVLKPCHYKPR